MTFLPFNGACPSPDIRHAITTRTCMYPQNWVQGEKSEAPGSVMAVPVLSTFVTGVPPGE